MSSKAQDGQKRTQQGLRTLAQGKGEGSMAQEREPMVLLTAALGVLP